MIIGACGPFASGKDTVADYLVTKGFYKISSGDILREQARDLGIETTRENLQDLGTKMKAEQGGAILIKLGLKDPTLDTVIVGLRHPDEIKYLRQFDDFYLINVTADRRTRYQRAVGRNKLGDNISSYEEFIAGEQRELSQPSGGQMLTQTMALADEVIENDHEVDQLKSKIDNLVNRLKRKFHGTK